MISTSNVKCAASRPVCARCQQPFGGTIYIQAPCKHLSKGSKRDYKQLWDNLWLQDHDEMMHAAALSLHIHLCMPSPYPMQHQPKFALYARPLVALPVFMTSMYGTSRQCETEACCTALAAHTMHVTGVCWHCSRVFGQACTCAHASCC